MNEKRKIILKEGVDVDIIDLNNNSISTKALIGRLNKTVYNTIPLEYFRKIQFSPDVVVNNGDYVYNRVTNEFFTVLSSFNEIIKNQIVAKIAYLLKCNATITIGGEEETADENGNIYKTFIEKYKDLKIYVQTVTQDLKQYDMGLHEDSEYLLYASLIDVSLLDKVVLVVNSKQIPLKIVSLDYVTYSGITRIEAKTETRD